MSAAQLKKLKAAYRYASGPARRELHAMIRQLECPEERSGTAREAPSTGMRDGTAPAAVQTPPTASVGARAAAPLPDDIDKQIVAAAQGTAGSPPAAAGANSRRSGVDA